MRSWRILITNVTLATRTGTETVVRDLALGLLAAGHRPMVYSPELGDIATEIQAAGVPVAADLRSLPEAPDLIHGNHHVELVASLLQFPAARGLFVCHHRTDYTAAPPRMDRIRSYVAVDHLCLERLTGDYGIPEHLTRVIYNSVDTDRFLPRPPLPSTPARALVFSNYASRGTHLEAVRVACAMLNLPLDVIGSNAGNSCAAPEQLLGEYDLVFAKARCALEAMAVGTAVILCDAHGLGPMVTASSLAELRPWNFGRRVLRGALEPAAIVREVHRYDAADASIVSRYIREHAALSHGVQEYIRLYDEIMQEPACTPIAVGRELDQYVRASATRIHELETALAELRRPYRMEPLAESACAHFTLLLRMSPETVERASAFQVQVELENGCREKLGSFPPFPLHWSYRWLSVETGSVVVADGPRTMLRPSLPPGEKATYSVKVIAPDEPGDYRLRVTLVQEEVAWLDTLAHPVSADAVLTVI